jgi:hypothetical protein
VQQHERGQRERGRRLKGSDRYSSVDKRDVRPVVTRGPALLATVAALVLLNLGLAALIALGIGARGFVPLWAAAVLLVLGIVAAAVAVTLWRGYLQSLRSL